MTKLNILRKEYAQEEGFESWVEFVREKCSGSVSYAMGEIAERYMEQEVCAALDEAAEKATASYKYVGDEWGMNRTLQAYVNTESILNLKPKTNESRG